MPERIEAELWRGWDRSTPVPVVLTIVGEYGLAPCPECEGTGWWAYAEPEVPGGPCVECKGTAEVWVLL